MGFAGFVALRLDMRYSTVSTVQPFGGQQKAAAQVMMYKAKGVDCGQAFLQPAWVVFAKRFAGGTFPTPFPFLFSRAEMDGCHV